MSKAITSSPARFRALLWLWILASLGALGCAVSGRFSGGHIWDDAFIFSRYADNFLDGGGIAWNPGGPQTYGLTAPLFLAVVVPARVLFRGDALAAMAASSLASGALFLVLALALVRTAARQPPVRLALCGLTLFVLALAGGQLADHMVSGMDTMFAMAFLAAYILCGLALETGPSRTRAAAVGLLGGIAYLARPDLMTFTLAVPFAMAVFGRAPRLRRCAARALAITLLVAGLEMALAYRLFGTPVPLPFYAKSGGLYGPAIHQFYRSYPWTQFAQFAAFYAFPILVIAVDLAQARRRQWTGGPPNRGAADGLPADKRPSPLDVGLLAGTAILWVYYLFFVLHVMGMGSRFYYTSLPALLFVAARSLVRVARRSIDAAAVPRRIPTAVPLLACMLLVSSLVPPARQGLEKAAIARRIGKLGRFDLHADMKGWGALYWFGIDEVSRLPDDAVLATTEVGYLSVLNPRKRVIDLSGLNDREVALHGFSADRLLTKERPDVLYMPHPHYAEMAAAILAHPAFNTAYEYFAAGDLARLSGGRVDCGVALRRDGPYYVGARGIFARGFGAGRIEPSSPGEGGAPGGPP